MQHLDRSLLKAEAKASLEGKWGSAVLLTLLYMLVTGVVMVPSILALVASDSGRGLPFTGDVAISLAGVVLTLIFLHVFDGTDRSFGQELASPFTNGKAAPTLINWLMTVVFTFLWTLLLIIPGIIARYSYALSYYLTDDWASQGYKVTGAEAVTASKQMMRGHKWELFVLDLSFLGWYLLVAITFGLASFYVTPYHLATRAAFYRGIVALEADQQAAAAQAAGQSAAQAGPGAQPQA
ncbi:hypothetical protein B9G54_07325 [Alloscardovia macacae]|uniref:DUF975 domain-containing protein n=1 Tax=Alloscardovia macacae TaxID=1160091 RepID=A0A1Y2SZ90_9BIFI|nr:DUF975 family protein [Alloscardovia macacae]OTA25620.1 hypothetical protein B9G54_07325 [Alloscardovia macacae]OTA28190.1 hypothetical protein B9T39_07280 [Alloscardovia macacae]